MSAPIATALPTTHADTANRQNLALLIQLRWIAVVGQIVTIVVVVRRSSARKRLSASYGR